MKNLINILDLTTDEIYELINIAKDIKLKPEKYQKKCKNKILATLFFEPSTRTRLSFESAMLNLGGQVISVSDSNTSSATKGESIADTAKIVSNYSDIIAMRHPKEGAPLVASLNSKVPLINAGDGGHLHPTQTLADLYTIYENKKTFDNLTIGICGDLKYGRTVHSLIAAMSRYKNVKLILISPNELKLPDFVKEEFINTNKIDYIEECSLEKAINKIDILYMTRVQKERFNNIEEFNKLKDIYILDEEKMKKAKKDMIVLHPLPRVNEISVNVDKDKRALYFEQAANGKFMRMALIIKMLNSKIDDSYKFNKNKNCLINILKCDNGNCITSCEKEIDNIFTSSNKEIKEYKCIYCESKKILK